MKRQVEQRAREKQRETLKSKQTCPFWGDNRFSFLPKAQKGKKKAKKANQKIRRV